VKEAGTLTADGNSKGSFQKYSWGTGSAEQALMRDKAFGAKVRQTCGYETITWSPTCLDMTMPTPVSDGKRVFIVTGRRCAFALDLDGRFLWQVWQSDAPYNGHYPEDLANSPWIAEGKLLIYVFDHLWAWELDTGKLAWKALSKARFRHGMGTPVLITLKTPDGKGSDAFLYLWTGDLVRIRDGRIMQRDLCYAFFASMTSDRRDALFISTMPENCVEHTNLTRAKYVPQLPPKGRTVVRAVRFACEGPDTVTWKELWSNGEVGLGHYPIFFQDRIYTADGTVLDAQDGKVLTKTRGKDQGVGSNGVILAGDRLYGQPMTSVGWPRANRENKETRNVVRVLPLKGTGAPQAQPLEILPGLISEPEQVKKVVAMTGFQFHKSDYGWYSAYACPFAEGDRLYVRTFDALYCFGAR
jgi:hypothetical protein